MADVDAHLAGFVAPGWGEDGRLLFDLRDPASMAWGRRHPVRIRDARALQAKAASEAEQFARCGFALLPHRTAVTGWDAPRGPDLAGSEMARVYFPEIEAIIRERLLPGRTVMVQQFTPPLRRGRDTATPGYGSGVHQDFGLTPDDYIDSVEAWASPEAAVRWREAWGHEGVEGFMVIDFWRTTEMGGPLEHMPLALCDPASVELADVVPTGLLNFSPTGRPTNNLALRWREGQSWWFYPGMEEDEVLAFKLFEIRKDAPEPAVRSCFHAAFADPRATEDARPRQSCEHRVMVWLLQAPVSPAP
jgi:hypothetical protein